MEQAELLVFPGWTDHRAGMWGPGALLLTCIAAGRANGFSVSPTLVSGHGPSLGKYW